MQGSSVAFGGTEDRDVGTYQTECGAEEEKPGVIGFTIRERVFF